MIIKKKGLPKSTAAVHRSTMVTTGLFGIMAFSVFAVALIVFGMINPEFGFLNEYISKLGAKGEPLALWWNLIGFSLVGVLLMVFGMLYGKILQDRWAGILLALFGVGFAFTAIPADWEDANSVISRAHKAAICLALACWLFGLAKISSNKSLNRTIRYKANVAAIVLVGSIIGLIVDFWSMPMTHRLVFGVVFLWTVITSVDLLLGRGHQVEKSV